MASIRYYEQIGLLPNAARLPGGHRVFGMADVDRLNFIRRCRDFGFSVVQIRELLGSSTPGTPCTQARDVAAAHLATIRRKLEELGTLERMLAAFVDKCSAECGGGTIDTCTLFDDLSGASRHRPLKQEPR